MAKLILSMDGLVLKEVPLTKERTTIGRRPHNDVVIDNLAVSGEHAVIVTILNDSFLEDLGSTNGTMVNGQAIKKHFLQNNDMVELGKYKLKYVAETAKQTSANDFEKTMVLRPNMMPKPAATPPAPVPQATPGYNPTSTQVGPMGDPNAARAAQGSAAAAAPQQSAVIQILNGPNAGKELALTKALTTLGRPGVQVAVITRRPQGYFITHVEGTTFPVVNGKNLSLDAHPLNNHDIVELSGTKMEFFFK
jgi:pSer/pThr/pTyr-binding forkhead associated (FHA) protein